MALFLGSKLQSEFEARKREQNTPRIHNLVTGELRFLEEPVGFLLDSFRRGLRNTIIRVYANGKLILNSSFLEAFAECGGPFKDAHGLSSNENQTSILVMGEHFLTYHSGSGHRLVDKLALALAIAHRTRFTLISQAEFSTPRYSAVATGAEIAWRKREKLAGCRGL